MLQTCWACNSGNRDSAKFCDQCGAPLSPQVQTLSPQALPPQSAAPQPAPAAPAPELLAAAAAATSIDPARAVVHPRPRSQVNWAALAFLAIIIFGIAYILWKPATHNEQQLGIADGGNTGGGGSGADNPMGTFQNVQKQLKQLDSTLKHAPLDTDALSQIYQLYGQVGEGKKARPYLDSALRAWQKANPHPDKKALSSLIDISVAALVGNDEEGGVKALEVYYQAEPSNLHVIVAIANIYYELHQAGDAVDWYEKYLKAAAPAKEGKQYWMVMVDCASSYMALDSGSGKSIFLKDAINYLTKATKGSPKLWQGWHNLGLAYVQQGDQGAAITAFKKAAEVGETKHDRWESQTELAKLTGKPAPPEPPQEQPKETGAAENPHAGLGLPPPGTPNPHAGMPGA